MKNNCSALFFTFSCSCTLVTVTMVPIYKHSKKCYKIPALMEQTLNYVCTNLFLMKPQYTWSLRKSCLLFFWNFFSRLTEISAYRFPTEQLEISPKSPKNTREWFPTWLRLHAFDTFEGETIKFGQQLSPKIGPTNDNLLIPGNFPDNFFSCLLSRVSFTVIWLSHIWAT